MFFFWALLLLGVLVLAHELGHFLVAKATGVKVVVFSIGFGPKVASVRLGETEYRLSAVPLGGYVKLLGQESTEDLPGGVVAIDPDGPAAKAGLRQGDEIIAVDDARVSTWFQAAEAIAESEADPLPLAVLRGGGSEAFSVSRTGRWAPPPPARDLLGREPGEPVAELGLSLGDHPQSLARAFFNKPLWVRFAVVFAGPAASMLFPILIYLFYFSTIDELTSNRIGQVLADSPAAQAGIQPGDRILAVGDQETPFWAEMAEAIQKRPGLATQLQVERDGKSFSLVVTPEAAKARTQIGEEIEQGRIGIASRTVPPLVGVSDPASPAAQAGLSLLDEILAVDGRPLRYIWELEHALKEAGEAGRAATLTVRPAAAGAAERTLTLAPRSAPGVDPFGLYSADTIVGRVEAGGPAEAAGIKPGDRIVAIDGGPVSAWMLVEQKLRDAQETPIRFAIERDGRREEFLVAQKKEVLKGEFDEEVTRFVFGAYSAVEPERWVEGDYVPVPDKPAFVIRASLETFYELTALNLRLFGMLLSGQVPFKMVGGPIMIFDIAGRAAEKGWQSYLWIMALISINLGVLNLLPIPVLDGGHLMFYTLELVLRRPLNQRLKERATMVGFALLMMLMAAVFYNDLGRYWDRIFG
ncbi:MAG: RIP metalloprotease RseP [Myxococcales bacterium]|nr:MAG: RIP metalloprotease RseP [Myxococcales bacterium]